MWVLGLEPGSLKEQSSSEPDAEPSLQPLLSF